MQECKWTFKAETSENQRGGGELGYVFRIFKSRAKQT